jgi:protein-S-isoprenylcysteine O-methyltransferase Ste14
MSQMQGLNLAKVLTILLLLVPALLSESISVRVAVYLSLHITYCVWWLLEQSLFPERSQQLFTERIGPLTLLAVLLYVGVFYAVPGWLAMANPNPIQMGTIAAGLVLYILGSLINTAADVQKMTAKSLGATLVSSGIWRRVRHVNYLGDLMRYSSFAVIAGSLWAWTLPLSVLLLYLARIREKEASMLAKYVEFPAYQRASTRLLPWLW